MGVTAVDILTNPALLKTFVPVDLFKLRFPTATAVLNTPATGLTSSTSTSVSLQAPVKADSSASLLSSTESQILAAQVSPVDAAAVGTSSTTVISTALAAKDQILAQTPTATQQNILSTENTTVPELPDPTPLMLLGAYRAPVVSHLSTGPYHSKLSVSAVETLQDVVAPTPVHPSSAYANGQPFNPNAYTLHPPAPETLAAHFERTARDAGMLPIGPQIVSGTYWAVVPHTLDLLA